jgi:hypothetical protein
MMRFSFLATLLAGMLWMNCGETRAPVQDVLKGTWKLSVRVRADGATIKSPDLAGLMEWFAVNERTGHLTVAVREQGPTGKALRLENGRIDIDAERATFEREFLTGTSYLSGDGPTDEDLSPKRLTARVSIDPAVTRLILDNGTTMAFEATRLTVAAPGRFTDTWLKE